MKRCPKCGILKSRDEFYKNKARRGGGLSSYCKPCSYIYRKEHEVVDVEKARLRNKRYRDRHPNKIREWRDKMRGEWINILREKFGLLCSRCGYDTCFASLDFHHIDPNEKEFGLGSVLHLKPTVERIRELDKGVLLCANCHRELHYRSVYDERLA